MKLTRENCINFINASIAMDDPLVCIVNTPSNNGIFHFTTVFFYNADENSYTHMTLLSYLIEYEDIARLAIVSDIDRILVHSFKYTDDAHILNYTYTTKDSTNNVVWDLNTHNTLQLDAGMAKSSIAKITSVHNDVLVNMSEEYIIDQHCMYSPTSLH